MTDILTLKNEEQLQLFDLIGETITFNSMSKSTHNDSREQRFADGVVCIHCGSMDVVKHGKKDEFAKDNGKEHIRIPSGKHKNGVYHISHVNSLHSKFRKWMERFNGVATKYLDNYLHWFKWLKAFTTEKDIVKAKHLIVIVLLS